MTARGPVGRDGEVAWLLERVRQPRDLGLSLTLVAGPAGVGRSHVLAAVAQRHDGPVCRAVALAWERSRPGALLHQLTGLGDVDPDPVVAAANLSDLLAADIPPEGVRLVVVDDAHLADEASIEVLLSLRRHHPDVPVRVLLGSPTASPATVAIARLSDARLDLSPLEAGDLARIAADLGVPLSPSAARRLRRHTGGLPGPAVALLTELDPARWAGSEELPAPAPVRQDVAARLDSLDPRTRRLVEVASVLGPDLTSSLAAEAAELSPGETWTALDEAIRTGLLTVSGRDAAQRFSPVDHLVAAAVRDGLGIVAIREMHLRAAAAARTPAEALPHRVAAALGPDAALADELEVEAVAVASEGAWARTAELLVDASRLSEDQRLREARLTRAVDALVGAGDVDRALALLPDVEGLRETPLRDAVLGYVAILRGRGGEARSQLDRAWSIVNVDREPDTAALVCQRFVLHALCSGAWSELVSWADRAVELVGPDHPAAVESAVIRGLGLAAGGDLDGARTAYAALTDRVLPAAQAQRASLGRGWLLLAADEVSSARAELERALPQRRDGGSTRISLWAGAWLARAHFVAGEWDDALRVAADGRDLVDRSGIALTGPLCDWTTVQVHVMRGDEDLALAALRAAEATTQDYAAMRVPTLLARAAWAEARADHEGVITALLPLTAPDLAEAVAEPSFWPWVDLLVGALVAVQRLDDADVVIASQETRVHELGHRSGTARVARARGRVAGARGDLEAARRSFDTALEALVGIGLRVERAHTLLAYGQVLRRGGKRAEADALLTSARDDYVAIGATAWVQRCDRELKAGGVRLARGEAGSTGLTPQEQAVAGLVARGRSNREVADVLFVSPKTVQFHLTRIYAKLGVRSRTELASRWERQD